MWKWSSARCKAAASIFLAVAALAGCNRESQSDRPSNVRASTVVDPELRVDAVPQEEPAVARSQWRASNDAAREVVGNLRVSIESVRGGPLVFAFASGVTIRAQSISVVPSDQRSGVGAQSFAAVLGGDPRVDAHIFRVIEENVTNSAAQGGLCGEAETKHLVVSEFVDSAGRWVFKIAAFRGERPPGASGEDPQLCRAYSYVAPG
ncbi:MAG: hypothetical protein WDM79_02885 [Terricaulis sp.]